MRRTRITVAAVTATALVGSIAAITLSLPPPASATSDKGSSVTQSAALRPDTNKTKIDADCRKAIINDLKLRAAIVDALIKAGLSAADAAALAPASPQKWQQRGPYHQPQPSESPRRFPTGPHSRRQDSTRSCSH